MLNSAVPLLRYAAANANLRALSQKRHAQTKTKFKAMREGIQQRAKRCCYDSASAGHPGAGPDIDIDDPDDQQHRTIRLECARAKLPKKLR
jgi:hypothetical protein